MAKPSNLGTYNQNLEFPDENVFQKSFEEGLAKQKNLVAEAHAKKKEEFLDKFYDDMRFKIMQPKDAQVIMTDEDGNKRINKGFYDISKIDPEDLIREAKKQAREAGLPSSMIKGSDITTERMDGLFNEAATRQLKNLAAYRDQYGEDALIEVLKNESKAGTDWHRFYQQYYDPWAQMPEMGSMKPEDWSTAPKKRNHRGQMTKAWQERAASNGWAFDENGRVTEIPGQIDPSSPVDVRWDNHGRPYVDTDAAKGFFSLNSLAFWQGEDWLKHWGVGPGGVGRRYIK
jgi:hypothetical protein